MATKGEDARRDQAETQAWITFAGGVFGIASLGAMAWTLWGTESLTGAVAAILALAGLLAIVVGGSVLELVVADQVRQERIRIALGVGAHSIASVALAALLLAFPSYFWTLAALLVLEGAQAIRYAGMLVGRLRDVDESA